MRCTKISYIPEAHGDEIQGIGKQDTPGGSALCAARGSVEDRQHVLAALAVYRRSSIGFSDALISGSNRAHGSDATATFDRKAAKAAGIVVVK
jgi:hypothetical protein